MIVPGLFHVTKIGILKKNDTFLQPSTFPLYILSYTFFFVTASSKSLQSSGQGFTLTQLGMHINSTFETSRVVV